MERASTSNEEVEYSTSDKVGLQTQQGVAQPEDFSINVTKSKISSSTSRRLVEHQRLVDFKRESRIISVNCVGKQRQQHQHLRQLRQQRQHLRQSRSECSID